MRKPKPKRYEVASPGQLVHVDIKKQGRIPDGGGWRVHGRGSVQDRAAGVARGRAARAGATGGSHELRHLHHAVDDHSRRPYSGFLDDERKETAAGFWTRANAFFASIGVTVTAVMTDNGAITRFADALGKATPAKHKWTEAHRRRPTGRSGAFSGTLGRMATRSPT